MGQPPCLVWCRITVSAATRASPDAYHSIGKRSISPPHPGVGESDGFPQAEVKIARTANGTATFSVAPPPGPVGNLVIRKGLLTSRFSTITG